MSSATNPSPAPEPGSHPRNDGKKRSAVGEAYQHYAETVGGVPSFNKRDNLIQGMVVGIGTLVTTAVGAIGWGLPGLMLGLLGGLIVFGLASGAVLLVLGWVRLVFGRSGK